MDVNATFLSVSLQSNKRLGVDNSDVFMENVIRYKKSNNILYHINKYACCAIVGQTAYLKKGGVK